MKGEMFSFENYYLHKDECGRFWKLIPVYNERISQPFLVIPLTAKRFDELLEKAPAIRATK